MTTERPPEPKAYSYIRFSTPQQAKGDSHLRQTDKAARYAAEHSLVLDPGLNLTDLGVSAYRGKNAKTGSLSVFLKAVEDGTVPRGSYLLVENIDRLTRDDIPDATMLFLQIINAGIVVVTLTNRERYSRERLTQEPHAIYFIISELIRANQESFRKGQLVGDAKERKRTRLLAADLRGKAYTRTTPGWIKWDDETSSYHLVPERVTVLREIFELAGKGWGLDRIARQLNAREVKTWGEGRRKASHWHGSYLRKIVGSKAPIGLFTPSKTTRNEVTGARRDVPLDPVPLWPAAVDEDLYWRVVRRFQTTAARGKNAAREPASLVAGVAKCTCGSSIVRVSKGASRGKHYVYLLCSKAHAKAKGCEYLPVRYDEVEEALRDNAVALVRDAPRGKNTARLQKDIENLQGYVDALDADAVSLTDLAARNKSPVVLKRLRDKERELEQRRAELREMRAQKDTMTPASVRARLLALEETLTREPYRVADANHALRQAIRRIVIDPKTATLDVHWHHSEQIDAIPFYSRHKRWE
jgi:DNA invertase Pin-like site-specific DNA recombinase